MTTLPKLVEGGKIIFATSEDLKSTYDLYLSKGALAVLPEVELQPLSTLEVSLEGGYIDEPIQLTCEVVVIQPDKSLLRILTPPLDALIHLGDAPDPGPAALSGPAWARLLAGDILSFDSPAHWKAGRTCVEHQGGVIAAVDDDAAPDLEMMLSIRVGAFTHAGGVLARLSEHSATEAAVYLEKSPLLDTLLDEVSEAVERGDANPPPTPEPTPAPTPEPTLEVARTPAAVVLAPPPPEAVVPGPVETPGPEPAPQPDPEPSDAPVVHALPPFLRGDALRFNTRNDFDAAGEDIALMHAVMAVCDAPPQPAEKRSLLLKVGDRAAETRVPATLSPGAGGTVIVQFDDTNKLSAAMVEVAAERPPSRDEAAEPAPGGEDNKGGESAPAKTANSKPRLAIKLAAKGSINNPSDVMSLLGLALSRELSADDMKEPSAHLLLRWLLTTKGIVRVETEFGDRPSHSFIVVNGSTVRASVNANTLGRALAEPRGRYVTRSVKRPPAMSTRMSILALMQETISALVSRFPDEELEQALAVHGDTAPKLNDVGEKLLELLEFPPSHHRIAERRLSGKERVAHMLSAASGARAVLEVLFVLDISGAIDWVDASGLEKAERQRKEKERLENIIRTAEDLWVKIEKANHFEALGLHWSTPPRKIEPTFRELQDIYGPSGSARAAEADACKLIWARLEEAFEVLKDPTKRKKHRKEVYPLKWNQQLDLMLDRADIAIYRKDFEEAHDLLMVCQDVEPSQKAAQLLKKMKEIKDKPRARPTTRDEGSPAAPEED